MSTLERHWSTLPGFSVRYAIRMPNGDLYAKAAPAKSSPAEDYSVPSPMRDMMGFFGFLETGSLSSAPPQSPKPEIFETRAQAEALLKELRDKAAQFGVTEWGGVIVAQLCTPFTSGDPTVDFANQIVAWLQEQGGAR